MNPNKLVAGGSSGGGLALGLVYLGSRLGWHLTTEDAGIIVFVAMHAGAFVAHNGVLGVWALLLRGAGRKQSGAEAGPTPPEPALPAA